MNRIEVGGDKWRSIGDPLTAASTRELTSLLADAPGSLAPTESAPQLGADHRPLATLVAMLAAARRRRAAEVAGLLGIPDTPSPFVLGLTGGVAVGKSMAAAAVATLLREQHGLTTAVVTTDGFLRTNATLEAEGLMHRKGFPESSTTQR